MGPRAAAKDRGRRLVDCCSPLERERSVPGLRLSEALGGHVEIYAKREDCNCGLAFGGNKIRKLEYIVPDAIASNADTLVTIGGVQSNHTRQVAAVAGGRAVRIGSETTSRKFNV